MKNNLFIVVNVDWFFLSHRLPVALAAQKKGWNVTIVTADTGKIKDIQSHGLKTINLPMSRNGINLFKEFSTFFFLYKLYKKEKPNVIHHVGMKTIIWGTLAAKFTKVDGIVNAISGLGSFFAENNNNLFSRIIYRVLKFSHNRHKILCIFQNHDDWNLYVKYKIINHEQGRFIKGSGVDLNQFCYTPEPTGGKIKIVFTGRMIKEKGIFLLTQAAEKLRKKYENIVEFQLIGGLDDHPGAITKRELDDVCDGYYIKWLGYRSDVREFLKKCHIMAFPSYYMEGLPKSLIEANAIGRPIITSNSVGCKEAVVDGYNGFLITPKDIDMLAIKLELLIKHPMLRIKMGKNSRIYAEKYFSIENVIKKHLEIYEELIHTN